MTEQDTAATVSVTASAAKRVAQLIAAEDRPDLKLRVAVAGGGCSGFQYTFDFDDQVNDDDLVLERDGVAVLIDSMSLEFLGGAKIDFVEDLIGAAFRIDNPNAQAACGCGTSFSI
ncbi:MAG: iron-sulfur cluster insertion protein ErpA [Alphaproteobacteria bacterium]|jgi:iron-sulfur cluster assembly accessory protein|nr:iron-sulfur cluster insertion protein ErpA [Alphaproteobacteria bacterium]